MRKFLVVAFLVVLALTLGITKEARADTSSGVTVIAYGYICGTPGGFTLTYINDWEVQLNWINGTDSVNTLVRAAYGHAPANISDGYLVYLGPNESCIDSSATLTSSDPVYYAAWSINSVGVYNPLFASGNSEDIMSASFLFIGWIVLSLGLAFLAFKIKLILFRIASALCWLGLGIYLLLGKVTNLSLSDTWTQVLAFVFFIMAIGCLLLQIRSDTEHTKVSKGRPGYPGAETESWKDWGPMHKTKKLSKSEEANQRQAVYRQEVRSRIQRGQARRQPSKRTSGED
jgi:hypothetical protein